MSDNVQLLRRKIGQAKSLGSVVKTMKNMAVMNIRQYEEAVRALEGYSTTIDLGLWACLHDERLSPAAADKGVALLPIVAVVFGSDQGLVGQFNDQLTRFVVASLSRHEGPPALLAVGERIMSRLQEAGFECERLFELPGSVQAITPLIAALLSAIESYSKRTPLFELHLFYHAPAEAGLSTPAARRLLPLDRSWSEAILSRVGPWPGHRVYEFPNGLETTRWALIREHLFVSLFKACAESLASENAHRLSSMQRAEKNIGELLEELTRNHNEKRQAAIDEELFDVVSGFQALDESSRPPQPVPSEGCGTD